jgi:hypothetical protein
MAKRFANVFKVQKRPNYEAMAKAVKANKRMPEAAKQKALATLRRKAKGF